MSPRDEPDARPPARRNNGMGSRTQRGADLARLSASTGAGYLAARLRGVRDGDEAEAAFHAATAQKMVELLGSMKGAAMKLGQIASFVDLDLPDEVADTYREVLASLRDDAPAADPEAIAQVLTDEYGAPAEQVFASFDPEPIAAASIGQVHRATLPDGSDVVVKVQYPGVAEAIEADLANAELFAPLGRMIAPNLELAPLLSELRDRLLDELDYQREAQYQEAFAVRYDGHPFIRVPKVHRAWCRPRVIVSERIVGADFDAMLHDSTPAEQRRYGEIIYRFVWGSLFRFRIFNGDPHPGNYLFPGDGSVAFLDFGSVKTFSTAARATLRSVLEATIADDAEQLVAVLDAAGFIPAEARYDPAVLLRWARTLYEPLLTDTEWTFTSEYARGVLATETDPRSEYIAGLRHLNLPAEYLLLHRIQWGVNSILGRLGARANWQRVTAELWGAQPPATELGEAEAAFIAASPYAD